MMRDEDRYEEIVANVSAYTDDPAENGYNGLSCVGLPLEVGDIAMDEYPLGTRVEINGEMYVVADRFGGGYTGRIDIFMPERKDALQFGRKTMTVKIYKN